MAAGEAAAGPLDLAPAAERIAASAIRLVGGRRARLYYRLDPDSSALVGLATAENAASPTRDSADEEIWFGARALQEDRAAERRGRAWAQSEPGRGSVFFLAIPVPK